MSALGIFPGRIASLNYQLVNTKNNAQVPKMVIQIITDDGYIDQNTKKWNLLMLELWFEKYF